MKGLRIAYWLGLLCAISCQRQDRSASAAFAFEKGRAPAKAVASDPSAEDYVGPELPRGRVVLKDAYRSAHQVQVEIAATNASRTRGLMWRRSLGEGAGMLFIFSKEQVQSFWMRNTLISLDMIFINEQRRIVGIVERAEPQTLTSRSVGRPSRYVLEVPAGWTGKTGIQTGSEVEFQGVSLIGVEP